MPTDYVLYTPEEYKLWDKARRLYERQMGRTQPHRWRRIGLACRIRYFERAANASPV